MAAKKPTTVNNSKNNGWSKKEYFVMKKLEEFDKKLDRILEKMDKEEKERDEKYEELKERVFSVEKTQSLLCFQTKRQSTFWGIIGGALSALGLALTYIIAHLFGSGKI